MADMEFTREIYDAFVEHTQKVALSSLAEMMFTSEFRTIWLISKNGGSMTPSEISKALNVTTPRVTVILNNLEKNKYINRTGSKEDRRKVIVTLTTKGKNTLKQSVDTAVEILAAKIDKAGKDDSEAVLRFLKKCNEADE